MGFRAEGETDGLHIVVDLLNLFPRLLRKLKYFEYFCN